MSSRALFSEFLREFQTIPPHLRPAFTSGPRSLGHLVCLTIRVFGKVSDTLCLLVGLLSFCLFSSFWDNKRKAPVGSDSCWDLPPASSSARVATARVPASSYPSWINLPYKGCNHLHVHLHAHLLRGINLRVVLWHNISLSLPEDSPLLDSTVQRPGWWRSPRLPEHSNVPSHSCRSLAGPKHPPMLRRFLTIEAVSVKNVASGCPRSYCRRSHPTRIWNLQHSLPTTALIAVLVWQSRGCPAQNSSKHSLRHVFFFLLLS